METGTTPTLSKKKKKISLKGGLIAAVAVAAVAGTGAGVYVWQHQKVTKLEKLTATLNEQTASLSHQNRELTTQKERLAADILKATTPQAASMSTFSVSNPLFNYAFSYPASWSRDVNKPLFSDNAVVAGIEDYTVTLTQPGAILEEMPIGARDIRQGALIKLYVYKTTETNVEKHFNANVRRFATDIGSTSVGGVKAITYSMAYEGTAYEAADFIKAGYRYSVTFEAAGDNKKHPAYKDYQAVLQSLNFK